MEANTTNDIQEIKESLGNEVVPAVTGKPSRVLKTKGKKVNVKGTTAGGASLWEIAAAINENPNMSVAAAIKQGRKEAKDQRTVEEGGKLTRGTKTFLKAALGKGLGGWLASVLDTKTQRDQKKFDAIQRKYEEGNFVKANFLKGLLGDKLGGMLAKATTLTSTKVSAFEKWKTLNDQRTMTATGAPDTPAEATRMTAGAAGAEAHKQLSEQEQAEETKEKEAVEEERKENKEFKKEVKEELEKIEKNTSKKGGLGWLLMALGAAIAGLLYANWDKIMKALGNLKQAYDSTVDWTSRNIIEPVMDAIHWIGDKIQPIIDWVAKHFGIESKAADKSVQQGVTTASGRGMGETLTKKAILAQAAEFHNKGNYAQEKLLTARAATMGDYDVYNPSTGKSEYRADVQRSVMREKQDKISAQIQSNQDYFDDKVKRTGVINRSPSVAPKAPPITAPQVGAISQANQDIKKENAQEDFMAQFQQAMGGAMMPNSLDVSTAKDVKDIKAALPALAQKSEPTAPVIKLSSTESSAGSYLSQIFEHPATWGAKP